MSLDMLLGMERLGTRSNPLLLSDLCVWLSARPVWFELEV